jgi:hypothetical protein
MNKGERRVRYKVYARRYFEERTKEERKIARIRGRLAKFAEELEGRYVYKIFVTLTFKDNVSDNYARWKFRTWLKSMRRKYKNMKYFWVVERQKRGVLHYHLVIWSNVKIEKPDLEYWHEGMSRVEKVRKNVVAYMSKYLTKDAVEGRMFGYSKGVISLWLRYPMYLWNLVKRFVLIKHLGCWEICDLRGNVGIIWVKWIGGVVIGFEGAVEIFDELIKLFDPIGEGEVVMV